MNGERAALGNQIEQDLFFCLFDIWTRAQVQNSELWEKLRKLVSAGEWVYRHWFIESWGLCCTALARRLIYMLYGGDNGNPIVEIYWPLIGSQSRTIDNSLRGIPLINTQHKRMNPITPGSTANLNNFQMLTLGIDGDKDINTVDNSMNTIVANNGTDNSNSNNIANTNNNSNNGNVINNNNNSINNNNNSNNNNSNGNVRIGTEETKFDNDNNAGKVDFDNTRFSPATNKKVVEVAYMQGQVSLFGQSTGGIPNGNINTNTMSGGDVLAMVTAVDVTEPRLVECLYVHICISLLHTCMMHIYVYIYIIYLWNEMLNILDLNSIADPECFAIAIAWVSYMVDLFGNVNVTINQRRSGLLPPNGNSVLQIFGNKLFTASLKINGFESAHAISLGGLCRIFCGRPFTIFEEKYLLNFYHTVENFLKNTQEIKEQARKQVIMHGGTLFACGFGGVRSLADVFLHHIRAIFQLQNKDARLRLCAINMLASFVCLEWHFWPTESVFVHTPSFSLHVICQFQCHFFFLIK
ncbi:hypothetical protein RFI_18101 [Reticulomyxa filosa]|uniref:Ral GTPase-activating protein subunit alpha/beta N-terminal domain-containing protein n=1 Tax=Reticulomyxa filosa TaxID=46433 RepID=X6N1D0_RETFI|nr:hypothetical protein RFI_18101 [Reticulomyxa filosa]|eukprot:ETO19137.1 hypothetical protein RFI_18101 [Reticulomyxa filosa]